MNAPTGAERLECGVFTAAFVRTEHDQANERFRPHESGAEATALQTLARRMNAPAGAERLECGVFTAAFVRTEHDQANERFASAKAVLKPPHSRRWRDE